MKWLDLRERVAELSRSPHPIVVLTLSRQEHQAFLLNPKSTLLKVPLFEGISRATNVSINVIDGELPVQDYRFPHSRTHVLLLDVRPIGIFGFAAQWGGGDEPNAGKAARLDVDQIAELIEST